MIVCDRALARAVALDGSSVSETTERQVQRATSSTGWRVLRFSPEIVCRARRPFPGDPLRTFDAIHLASVLVARSAVDAVALLSLDKRVRASALHLDTPVLPRTVPGGP